MAQRTGDNSVDLYSNTDKNGNGLNLQPILKETGEFKVDPDVISAIQSNNLIITNALDVASYNLQSAQYSGSTNISNDYHLVGFQLGISTPQTLTITITTPTSTIYSDTHYIASTFILPKEEIEMAINGGENITVVVSQATGACTMSLKLEITQGAGAGLAANPVLGAGSNIIGKVGIDQTTPGTTNKVAIEFADSPAIDAFARLRTSSPETLFDGLNEYDNSPLYFENSLTGGGTVTHLPNEASVSMNVGTASGDKVIRQSREYFRYTPGKSLLVIRSVISGTTKANVRRRFGYFDADNGLFFEDNGTNFGVVMRSKCSGSVVDIRVAQSAWNTDTLDGTGSSGITLDLSKDNIFVIDLEWLGSGRVRFGIYNPDGSITYCHHFDNANANTAPYMRTACLPLRAEIENTGTTASSSVLKLTCSAVLNEDSSVSVKTGLQSSISNGINTIAVTTRRAVLSIRPKATFNSIVNRAKMTEVIAEIFATTNNAFYEIVYNGTLGGSPSWTSVGSSSTVEYDTSGTTVTGGIVVVSGFAISNAKTGNSVVKDVLSKLPLTLDISGANPIILSIVCTSMSGTSNVSGSFNWLEIY